MNQRIQELANQMFSMEQFEYAEEFLNDEFMEKFAELIVKDCTGLLWNESERLYAYSSECNNERHSDEAELSAEKCLDNIKMLEEHFGIE